MIIAVTYENGQVFSGDTGVEADPRLGQGSPGSGANAAADQVGDAPLPKESCQGAGGICHLRPGGRPGGAGRLLRSGPAAGSPFGAWPLPSVPTTWVVVMASCSTP